MEKKIYIFCFINKNIINITKSFSGKGFLYVNQFNRDSNLYYIKYMLSGQYLHYAPDANYKKLAPTVFLNFRPDDFRDNRKQTIVIKEIIVDKQKTAFTVSENSENYQIFNAKYIDTKTEVTNHFSFLGDFQYSSAFGKLATEIQYRKLFDNNRSLNLRLFAGTFLHNKTTSNYFDFGLDRPSDYLFESDYLGRSETTGLFSQQSIIADGFFKSKLDSTSLELIFANPSKLNLPIFFNDEGNIVPKICGKIKLTVCDEVFILSKLKARS